LSEFESEICKNFDQKLSQFYQKLFRICLPHCATVCDNNFSPGEFSAFLDQQCPKIGNLGQKALLTFLQQCPNSAKPQLKKLGKNARSENGGTKTHVKK
jgi:hypothetical protein